MDGNDSPLGCRDDPNWVRAHYAPGHRGRFEEPGFLEQRRAALRLDAIAEWERQCPPAYKVSDWNYPKLAPYRAQIDRILNYRPESGKKGILAFGPTGRAKTRSMWQLVRNLAEDAIRVNCWHAIDWFTELQKQVHFGRDNAKGFVERCARSETFFIDDLGQEAVTASREDWARQWFLRFLDIRVGEGLPLLITTNLPADQITNPGGSRKELRTDPLLRRLLDLCEVVKFETAGGAGKMRSA